MGPQPEVKMARKKRAACLVLALGILSLTVAAKTAQVQSRWQKSALTVDGDISDWQATDFQTEKSVQVDYAFGNDAENLYLVFVFKDPQYLSSLAQTGFTVWFNDQGKKKKTLGVRFEKKTLGSADLIALMEKKSGPLGEEKKKEMLAKPAYVVNQFVAVNGSNDDLTDVVFPKPPLPEFTSQSASGRLAFEFRFPMGPGNRLNLAAGKTVLVGFDWGGMTKEMRRARLQGGGYEGGEGDDMPETPDLDPEGSGQRDSGGLPSLRGPKHYMIWCQLSLAAAAD
jgi:hypothetical protein